MPREVHKVVCYVLHDEHLLVFTHRDQPMAVTGVQVPAGTIESGESPERGAVRELFEETGRRGHLVRPVGVQRYDVRPMRDEIAVRHYFQLSMPGADVTERWSAAESDPAAGGPSVTWDCWWLPVTRAHVLAAGLGALVGAMLDHVSPDERPPRAG